MLLLLFISGVLGLPLNAATIYIDSPTKPNHLPYACVVYCPPTNPTCGAYQCNLTTVDGCDWTAFFNVKNSSIVGFYTKPPAIACDRETLYITKSGYYRIYIDKIGDIYRMSVENTLEPVEDGFITVTFTLGYIY